MKNIYPDFNIQGKKSQISSPQKAIVQYYELQTKSTDTFDHEKQKQLTNSDKTVTILSFQRNKDNCKLSEDTQLSVLQDKSMNVNILDQKRRSQPQHIDIASNFGSKNSQVFGGHTKSVVTAQNRRNKSTEEDSPRSRMRKISPRIKIGKESNITKQGQFLINYSKSIKNKIGRQHGKQNQLKQSFNKTQFACIGNSAISKNASNISEKNTEKIKSDLSIININLQLPKIKKSQANKKSMIIIPANANNTHMNNHWVRNSVDQNYIDSDYENNKHMRKQKTNPNLKIEVEMGEEEYGQGGSQNRQQEQNLREKEQNIKTIQDNIQEGVKNIFSSEEEVNQFIINQLNFSSLDQKRNSDHSSNDATIISQAN